MFLIGKDIVGSCFFIQSDNLCLPAGVFRPLIFDMIIDLFMFKFITLLSVSFLLCFLLNYMSIFSDSILSLLLVYYL